ncbi:MAG: DUF1579 domain-containing protein [Chthoniobacterales bacterium]
MKTTLATLMAAALLASPTIAQTQTASPATGASSAGMPSADDMKMMMEMAKPNENHKLLASMDGSWDYTVKMWMDGDTSKKPQESKGTAVHKSIMDGRFCTQEVTGKMEMPGPDGKMKSMDFHGMGLEAYDNAKKKFVGSWIDNMGTGIMNSEGDYDAASKTFTYTGEYQMAPGMNQKIKEVLKMTDKDHMTFEWYEDRGGKETKTMQIDYTRKK